MLGYRAGGQGASAPCRWHTTGRAALGSQSGDDVMRAVRRAPEGSIPEELRRICGSEAGGGPGSGGEADAGPGPGPRGRVGGGQHPVGESCRHYGLPSREARWSRLSEADP